MNLPPTYRHVDGYEPPRPAPVYDTPRIVERRRMLAWLRAPRPAAVRLGRALPGRAKTGSLRGEAG